MRPIHEPPPHNTAEGSEFIDDAIRIADLPNYHTTESTAADVPKTDGDTQPTPKTIHPATPNAGKTPANF